MTFFVIKNCYALLLHKSPCPNISHTLFVTNGRNLQSICRWKSLALIPFIKSNYAQTIRHNETFLSKKSAKIYHAKMFQWSLYSRAKENFIEKHMYRTCYIENILIWHGAILFLSLKITITASLLSSNFTIFQIRFIKQNKIIFIYKGL